jgi:hypothetical protein
MVTWSIQHAYTVKHGYMIYTTCIYSKTWLHDLYNMNIQWNMVTWSIQHEYTVKHGYMIYTTCIYSKTWLHDLYNMYIQ